MKKKEILQVAIVLVTSIFLINALTPLLTGSEKGLIVLSGSMTPIIQTGDIIIVEAINPTELQAGDIIAFRDPGGKDTFVTHRLINIEHEGGELIFSTKGDANEEEDFFKVPASDVAGKLIFVIPFAGYLPEASKNKTLFLITVLIPAFIIILDEMKTMITYSNPISAHKIERKRKKVLRRSYYKIQGKRLISIILMSGFVFTGIVMTNLGENGQVILQKENTVENSDLLPSVYVLIPEDSEQRLTIEPWYSVIPPKNEIQVHAPESMSATIISVPYILPVFWIVSLAETNSYLPVLVEIAFYTSIFTLFMVPWWYQKVVVGRRINRMRFDRLFLVWRKAVYLYKLEMN